MPLRAFHPKLYVFGTDPQTCCTLVGSANLTSRGFSVNTEAAWAQQGVPRADADEAFDKARFEMTALTDDLLAAYRSEERRVGKECVSTCRSRWSPHN